MITCKSCLSSRRDDPRERQPRWVMGKRIPYGAPSECDLCEKEIYYRELEASMGNQEVTHHHVYQYEKRSNEEGELFE